MKKATSRIWLITLTALALLSLGGCAQEKEENTEENDPQAREAILQMLRVDLWQRRGNGKLSHPRDGRAGRRARG